MNAAILTSVPPPLPPGTQEYLLQARQMQALSFAVHIPLVCFGIAFLAIILFVEWLYLRTGDKLYRTLAQRWTRVLVALFAVGVVTGTILSFEMGLLWPAFTGTFGGVFGLGFAVEGFSFFAEAIFIGIYVYEWHRLSPRAHFAAGIPIAIAGFTGSLTVISVNGWMNHPTGFTLRAGQVVDVHPVEALFANSYFWHELVHMYLAGYMVTGFMLAAAYAVGRLRRRWGRYERTALAIPLTVAAVTAPVQILIGDWAACSVAAAQPTKLAALEGLRQTTRGARNTCWAGTSMARSASAWPSRACSRCWLIMTPTPCSRWAPWSVGSPPGGCRSATPPGASCPAGSTRPRSFSGSSRWPSPRSLLRPTWPRTRSGWPTLTWSAGSGCAPSALGSPPAPSRSAAWSLCTRTPRRSTKAWSAVPGLLG
jgi:bd-type cytochrome oxidase subunit I